MKPYVFPILVLIMLYTCSCSKTNKDNSPEGLIKRGTWYLRQIDSIGYDSVNHVPFHLTHVIAPTNCASQRGLVFYPSHTVASSAGCGPSTHHTIEGTWSINQDMILWGTGTGPRGFFPPVVLSDTIKKITPDSLVLSLLSVKIPEGYPLPDPHQPQVLTTYTH